MRARIYKMLLNRKETVDSYTIWLKPTKKAIKDGAIINARHCNVLGDEVWGYWSDYPANTRIGVDIKLGKRMKEDEVPKPILELAQKYDKIYYEACKTGDWNKWSNI